VDHLEDCDANVLVREKRHNSTLLILNKLRSTEKPIVDNVRKKNRFCAAEIQIIIERRLLVEGTS
jgi:hypothetical protein